MRSRMRLNCTMMALTVAFAVVTGCAHETPTPQQLNIPGRAATLEGVQEDYEQAESQVESTDEALHELYVSPYADLQQAADSFENNARMMLAIGDLLVKHADGMHFLGQPYLVERVELPPACPVPGAPPLLGIGTAKLDGYFDAIADQAWEVKRAYRAYQFDIQQITGTLKMDVTPVAVTPVMVNELEILVRKTRVDSENLRAALEQAQGAIDEAMSAKVQATELDRPKSSDNPKAAASGQTASAVPR